VLCVDLEAKSTGKHDFTEESTAANQRIMFLFTNQPALKLRP
jgi:hypothetical protein